MKGKRKGGEREEKENRRGFKEKGKVREGEEKRRFKVMG